MKNLVLMLVAAGFGYGVCWIQQLSPDPEPDAPRAASSSANSSGPPRAAALGPTEKQLMREIGKPLVVAKTESGYFLWIYKDRVVFVDKSGAKIGSTIMDPTNTPDRSFFSAPEDPSAGNSPRKAYLVTRSPKGAYQIELLPPSTGVADRGRFDNTPPAAPSTSGLRGSALDQRPGR